MIFLEGLEGRKFLKCNALRRESSRKNKEMQKKMKEEGLKRPESPRGMMAMGIGKKEVVRGMMDRRMGKRPCLEMIPLLFHAGMAAEPDAVGVVVAGEGWLRLVGDAGGHGTDGARNLPLVNFCQEDTLEGPRQNVWRLALILTFSPGDKERLSHGSGFRSQIKNTRGGGGSNPREQRCGH